MTRQEILKAAEDCVCRDRQATHGAPENSFGKLAAVWSARLGIDITPAQTTILLSDLKTVRAWDNPDHADNWVDGVGYMACGGELAATVKESLTTQQPSKEPEAKPKFAVGQVWSSRNGEHFTITAIDNCSPFPIKGSGDGRSYVCWSGEGMYYPKRGENDDDLVRLISDPEDAA